MIDYSALLSTGGGVAGTVAVLWRTSTDLKREIKQDVSDLRNDLKQDEDVIR